MVCLDDLPHAEKGEGRCLRAGFLVRGLRQGLRKVSPRCCRPTVDGLGKTECRFCWCPLVLVVDTYRL
jgi:hypothetical protein